MRTPSSAKLNGVTSAWRRFGQPFPDSKNSLDARNRNQQGRREERRTGSDGECRKSLGVNFGGGERMGSTERGEEFGRSRDRNRASGGKELVRAYWRKLISAIGGVPWGVRAVDDWRPWGD